MAHFSQGQAGVKAVNEKRYDEGIELLTKATAIVKSPPWLLALAQAHQHNNDIPKALECTSLAYQSAFERAHRKYMIDAQYRRAVLLYRLHRYADADCCAVWSQMLLEGLPPREVAAYPGESEIDLYTRRYEVALAEMMGKENKGKGPGADWESVQGAMGGSGANKDKKRSPEWNRAFQWRVQALGALEKLPQEDPARKVTVTLEENGEAGVVAAASDVALAKTPLAPVAPTGQASPAASASASPIEAAEKKVDSDEGAVEQNGKQNDKPLDLESLKPKVDFYQTAKSVTLSVFMKNADKVPIKVAYGHQQIILGPFTPETHPSAKYWVSIATPDVFNGGGSRHTVSSRKVELVLEKGTFRARWPTWGSLTIEDKQPSLSASQPTSSTAGPESTTSTTSATPSSSTAGGPLAYPTSSKRGPQNWDGVATEAGGNDEDEADVNGFFKKLYAGASPEQQRAMMKSFVESNGTALSTDWNDVGNRTVETVPPDGVEPRKWDT